jgi:hypothetical protein
MLLPVGNCSMTLQLNLPEPHRLTTTFSRFQTVKLAGLFSVQKSESKLSRALQLLQ